MDKLDLIKQKIEEIQAKSAVASEMKAFISLVLRVVKETKENFDKTSKENLHVIQEAVKYISQEHSKIMKSVSQETDDAKKELKNEIEEVKKIAKELKSIEYKDGKDGVDGKDANPEDVVPLVLKEIKFPEETGETIVDKINALSLEEENKIDAKHIKNLPSAKGGHSPTVLANAVDLDQTARADGYAIVWDATNARFKFASAGGGTIDGSGTTNELTYWVDSNTIGSLSTATYPSLTELSYVKGVTSAIQTQINTKAPSTSPTFATSITGSYLTASEMLITDGSKNIVSAPVATYPSLTELTYLKGVTSAIQTQLNNKQGLDTQLTSLAALSYTGNALKVIRVNAGETDFELATVSALSDGDKGDITVSASGATWTIDNDVVTYAKMQNVSATSRILGRITAGAGDVEELTDANVFSILGVTSSAAELNILDGATLSTTELNYVDGVTSSIQTQLDAKIDGTMVLNRIPYGSDSNTLQTSSNLFFDGNQLGVGTSTVTASYRAEILGNATYTKMLRLSTAESYPDFLSMDSAFGQVGYFVGTFKGVNYVIGQTDGNFIISKGAVQLLNFDASTTPIAITLNEGGNNVDTRIEGDTDANLVFVDASTDRVGIGTATPGYKLDVNGTGNFSGDVTVPDEAYGAGWNGNTEVPTKNAVYDKIESISGGVSFGSATQLPFMNAGATDFSYSNKLRFISASGVLFIGDNTTDTFAEYKTTAIIGGTPVTLDTAGNGFIILASQGNGTGSGGILSLGGGEGGATGNGGDANLYGGSGGATSGHGGHAIITGGTAQGGDSNGGDVIFYAGTKTGAGTYGVYKFDNPTAGDVFGTLDFNSISADRTFTFPDADGTLALVSDITGTNSGTNTGDQNVFQTIAVSGQSNVVADSTTDTLTLVAGTNITITTDAGTDSITINSTASGGLTWNEVTGISQSASINNGYITNNASLVTVTLPSTAAVGSIVRIAGKGTGGWRVAQNASEVIHFGNVDTTTGTGGRLDSTDTNDAVELLCIVADTEWMVLSSQGNITIT